MRGFCEKWFAWDAISLAIPSEDSGRFWPAPRNGKGVVGAKSANGPCEPLRLPGVALKTEYSSAKRGVQPPDSSKRPWWCLGVSKTGLGKMADVGVCLGVGG